MVEKRGAITRETPANVWAVPIVVPNSDLSDARDIIAVVAGNNRAVPIGTSGITSASIHRLRARGYPRRPQIRATMPARIDQVSPILSTTGPMRAERMATEKI